LLLARTRGEKMEQARMSVRLDRDIERPNQGASCCTAGSRPRKKLKAERLEGRKKTGRVGADADLFSSACLPVGCVVRTRVPEIVCKAG